MSKEKKFGKELLSVIYKHRKLGPEYIRDAMIMEAIYCSDAKDPSEAVKETLEAFVEVAKYLNVQLVLNTKPTIH